MLQLPEPHRHDRTCVLAHDPIFALIASHHAHREAANKIYHKQQDAEDNAEVKFGLRPIALISWRNYTIGAGEIEVRRAALLDLGIEPHIVETEYKDAKARYAAQIAAGNAWDVKAGLTGLVKKNDRAWAALKRSQNKLAKVRPTTPAGAAALLKCILDDDLSDQSDFWHLPTLKSLVGALAAMQPEVNRS